MAGSVGRRADRGPLPHLRLPATTLILDPVTVQIVAVGVEPGLGALDVAADFRDDPPEPRRMVHLDQMRDLMRGEIVQHKGRREDQPPGKRQ